MPNLDVTQSIRHPQGLADFTHDETDYIGLSQYFYYQKSLFLGDAKTADKILKAKDDGRVKELAKQIQSDVDAAAWDTIFPQVLLEGLKAKILQDPQLRHWLAEQDPSSIPSVQGLWGLNEFEITRGRNGRSSTTSGSIGLALKQIHSQL